MSICTYTQTYINTPYTFYIQSLQNILQIM